MQDNGEMSPEFRVWIFARAILIGVVNFGPRVEAEIISRNWLNSVSARAADRDFAGSWQTLQVAVLREKAFEGPSGVLPAQVEGENVGLPCDPVTGKQLVAILYQAMFDAGWVPNVYSGDFRPAPDWGPISFDGGRVADALMPEGLTCPEDVVLCWKIAAIAQHAHRRFPLRGTAMAA